jgi:hypothetical protein
LFLTVILRDSFSVGKKGRRKERSPDFFRDARESKMLRKGKYFNLSDYNFRL